MLFHRAEHLAIPLAILILFVGQSRTLVSFKNDLFTLRATVTELDVKSNSKVSTSRISGYSLEHYSSGQMRGVVNYALLRRQLQVGQLFYDSKDRQSLRYEHLDKSCRLVERPGELNLLPNLDVSSLNLDTSPGLGHVIGLARLLLFVEQHKDELKMVGEPMEKHNMVVVEYSYSFDNVQLNIYYSGMALSQDANAPPMQIIVSAQQQVYAVDFSRLASFSSIEQEVSHPDGIYIDQFAFPRECASQLRGKWEQSLIEEGRFCKFSFQAKISNGNTTRSFMPKISYYHNMDLLSASYGNKRARSRSINARSVVNFRFKRAYQVIERAGPNGEPERKCYVFKTASLRRQRQTVSETLTGANSFVYLGLAEVRGSTARLYAASEATVPLWLEQPLEYSSNGSTKVRDPLAGMDSTKWPLKTLIYVANDDRVVQMELVRPKYRLVVELFNFKWDLDPMESASDLFSLRLACANTNGVAHSQVQMSLGKFNGQQLEVPTERFKLELSLLKVIQEDMSIPATMVYDLEAKLIAKRDLFVSFRVASHTDNIESLTYLGKGEVRDGHRAELVVTTSSFQTCFQLATKQKGEKSMFGYHNRNKKCALITTSDDVELKEDEERDGGLMEFYEAEHEQVEAILMDKEGINGRWLEDSRRDIYRQKLIGERLTLDIPGPSEPQSIYQIKRLQVKTWDEQETGLPVTIQGFGLLGEDGNRHYEGSLSQMSLAECRAGCLASDSCQSYSVCRRPQGLQCILSSASFQSDGVKKQLAPGKATQNDKYLDVTLDDGRRVKLLRRPSCDLYNKLYMNLFNKDGKSLQSISPKQRLMPTPIGEEDCAKICVELNLQVLAHEALLSSKLGPLLSSTMTPETEKGLENLLAERKENSERLCAGFLYMDNLMVGGDEEKLAAKFKMSLEDLKSFSGYCSLEVSQQLLIGAIERPQVIVDDVRFTYMRYKFNLAHFYTARKGVRLLASNMSNEQMAAHGLVKRHSSELTEAQYGQLRASLDLSSNLQEVFMMDERSCAGLCFFGQFGRSTGPWPVCKSFDVAYNDRRRRKVCYLNSISLSEAVKNERSSLVGDQSNGPAWIEWTHYEPVPIIAQNIESLAEARLEVEESNWFRLAPTHIINGFFLFIFSWLAILAGLFVGVRGAQRLLINQGERTLERASIARALESRPA